MSTCALAISSTFIKKFIISFHTLPNSRTMKALTTPSHQFSCAIPMKKIMNKQVHDKSNLVSLVAQLLVMNNQSNNPPEIPGQTPTEIPKKSDYDDLPYSAPPEVPELPKGPEIETTRPPDEGSVRPPKIREVPNTGPDFPVPPLPSPPAPPDSPLPPPGTPLPPPPDQLPPKLPPDPDIIPPPTHPPPDIQTPPGMPPDIKPPTGPYVV